MNHRYLNKIKRITFVVIYNKCITMIALVYVTIALIIIYIVFSYIKFDAKDSINPHANLGK